MLSISRMLEWHVTVLGEGVGEVYSVFAEVYSARLGRAQHVQTTKKNSGCDEGTQHTHGNQWFISVIWEIPAPAISWGLLPTT